MTRLLNFGLSTTKHNSNKHAFFIIETFFCLLYELINQSRLTASMTTQHIKRTTIVFTDKEFIFFNQSFKYIFLSLFFFFLFNSLIICTQQTTHPSVLNTIIPCILIFTMQDKYSQHTITIKNNQWTQNTSSKIRRLIKLISLHLSDMLDMMAYFYFLFFLFFLFFIVDITINSKKYR